MFAPLSSLVLVVALHQLGAPPSSDCARKTAELVAWDKNEEAVKVGESCPALDDETLLPSVATARIMLGHGAHAAAHIHRYRAQPYADDALAEYLTGLIRGKVIAIEVDTSENAGVLRAEFLNADRTPLEFDYDALPTALNGRELLLDPGEWRLTLLKDGEVVATETITARAGKVVNLSAPTPPVALPPAPVPPPPHVDAPTPPPPRKRVALALGIASGTTSLAGIGVLFGRMTIDKPTHLSTGATQAQLNTSYKNMMVRADLLWRSMTLVGTGLGGGAVALTELLEAPHAALFGELGGGALMAFGGAVYTGVNTAQYFSDTNAYVKMENYPGVGDVWLRKRTAAEVGSGLLLGTGIGLATGAATSLIVHAIHKRRAARKPPRGGSMARRRAR